jgi:hypothetical protein
MPFLSTQARPAAVPFSGSPPRPPRIRRTALAAICAAVAVTAAACSSSGSSSGSGTAAPGSPAGGQAMSASKALKLAAGQARKVTSLTANMNISSSGTFTSHLTGTLEEQIQPTVLAHQTFHLSGGIQHLPGTMQTLLTSNAVYLKISSLANMLGKPWVKIPFSSLRQSGLNLAPIIHQIQSENPLAETQMLVGATNARQAGSQVINGVPTTEYTGVIHAGTAMASLSPSMRKLLRPALAETGIKVIHFKVWVDGQHQVRKLAEVLTGSEYRVSSVITITSINQPVHIQVPPASQVANVPGM